MSNYLFLTLFIFSQEFDEIKNTVLLSYLARGSPTTVDFKNVYVALWVMYYFPYYSLFSIDYLTWFLP